MAIDLDRLMSQHSGAQPKTRAHQQQRSPRRASEGVDLDALMARHMGHDAAGPIADPPRLPQRPARPLSGRTIDQATKELLEQVRAGELVAKPSVLMGILRDRFGVGTRAGDALRERHGEVLADLRRRLPDQPPTPRRRPKQARQVPRWRLQRQGPAERMDDTSTLDGWPLAAEAFAGGGLFNFALTLEGIYVYELCEYDQRAVETLRLNLHDYAVSSDANAWTPTVPDGGLDLLVGGPPCQPFSKARTLGGDYGTTKENMFPRVLDWIADSQPRIVCLENSPQIVRSQKFKRWFAWWWKQVDALGYEGTHWLVSAAEFGTPQLRERSWTVCWPKGAPWGRALRQPPAATHGRPGTPEVEQGKLLPWTSAFDRLHDGCCAGWGKTDCELLGNVDGMCSTCVDANNYIQAPNSTGGSARRKMTPGELALSSKWGDARRLKIQIAGVVPSALANAWVGLSPKERKITRYLAPALLAGIGKSGPPAGLMQTLDSPTGYEARNRGARRGGERAGPSVCRYVESLERMGVRDAAKLQDVPQWYAFTGDHRDQFRQIGNGIAVNMGRAVARHLRDALGLRPTSPAPIALRGVHEGLWPTDHRSMCAWFPDPWHPGLDGYFGSFTGPYQKPSLTSQQRQRRRWMSREQFNEQRAVHQQVAERQGYWTRRSLDEPADYNWSVLADWEPLSWSETPPGFWDSREYENLVQGEGFQLHNHLVRAYMKGMDASAQVVADKVGFELQPSRGYPSWSPYR